MVVRKKIQRLYHHLRRINFHSKIFFPILILLFLCTVIVLTTELVQNRQNVTPKAVELLGDPPTKPKIDGLVLPSVNGFQSDAFTGHSTVSYPIGLPAGPAGLKPNLSINYSSGTVDDLKNGVDGWEYVYPAQASFLGLGWQLSGIDGITAVKDGRYFASIQGISYELINERYTDRFHGTPETNIWHTNPESYIKIEHPIINGYGFNNLDPWTITTKDGTKYTFGSTKDETYNNSPEIATAYEIQDNHDGHVSKKVGYKWMVKKIEDTHGNTISFQYQTETGTNIIRGVVDGSGCEGNYGPPENHQYISFIRPTSTSWNNNHYRVEFEYADRQDNNEPVDSDPDRSRKKIHNESTCNSPQQHYTTKRLAAISIKVDDQLQKKHTFNQVYGRNFPKHLLLNSITSSGTDVTNYPRAEILPTNFDYFEDDIPDVFRNGNTVYLKSANNGYGGKVSYEYKMARTIICDKNSCQGAPQGPSWSNRMRVYKKTTEDGMGNSFKTVIDYQEDTFGGGQGGLAFGEIFWVNTAGIPVTPSPTPTPISAQSLPNPTPSVIAPSQIMKVKDYEFLGHAWTKETLYEKNDEAKKVTVSKSYFNQLASASANSRTYYFPSPLQGKIKKTEKLNPTNEDQILQWAESKFEYRKNPEDPNVPSDPEFDPVDAAMEKTYHPFIGLFQTKNRLDGIETQTDYEYDRYGNQRAIIDKGDLSVNEDETKTVTDYIYDDINKWIINKPLLVRNYRRNLAISNPADPNYFQEFMHTGFYYDNQGWNAPPIKGDVTKDDKVSLANGTAPEIHVVTSYTYDGFGNPTDITDPRNSTTHTEYDRTYNVFPVTIKSPEDHITTTGYDYLLGVPKSTTDANGVTTRFEYDSLGRKIKTYKDGDPNDKPSTQNLIINAVPMAVGIKSRIESGQDQLIEKYSFYNGLGQLIQEQSYGPENNQVFVENTAYNSLGTISRKYIPYSVNSPQIGRYLSPNINFLNSSYEYDSLGRITKVVNLDQSFSTYAYSGYKKTVVDEAQVRKVHTHDAFGNTIKLEEYDPVNHPNANPYATTEYKYDYTLGVLTKIIDPKKNTTTITYDNFGRKRVIEDPDVGKMQFLEYDHNNNLIKQLDNKNQLLSFEYDQMNRVKKKIYPDGKSVVYLYNEGRYGKGKLTGLINENETIRREFDKFGRVATESATINVSGQTNTFNTQYSYNNLNNVTSFTHPDGEQVQYSYHQNGMAKGLKIVGGLELVTDTTYTPQGQMDEQFYGNNTVTSYTYFPNDLRLSNIKTTKNVNSPGPSDYIFDNSYTYNPVGNITSINNRTGAGTERFIYDGLNRLTSVRNIYDANYEYDESGNIKTKTEGQDTYTMEYNSIQPAHSPKKVNTVNLSYDNNGNLTQDETHSNITYDYENRPTSITTKIPTCYQGGIRCNRLPVTPPRGVVMCNQCCYGFRPIGMTGGICKTQEESQQSEAEIASQNSIIASSLTGEAKIEIDFIASPSPNPSSQGHVVRLFSQKRDSPEPPSSHFGPEHCNGNNTPPTVETAQQGKWLYCGTDINKSVTFTLGSPGQKRLYAIIRNDKGEAAPYWGGTANGWTKPITKDVDYQESTNSGPNTITFIYGPDGARIAKTENGTTTLYVGSMEKNLTTGEIIKYYNLNGKYIATKDNSLSYLVTDHLDSVRAVSDSNGNRIRNFDYYPYGTIRWKTGNPTSRLYTSQVYDKSTNLYYYNARYYNPLTGLFIQPDNRGINKYAYSAGNPLRYSDPTGHQEEEGGGDGSISLPECFPNCPPPLICFAPSNTNDSSWMSNLPLGLQYGIGSPAWFNNTPEGQFIVNNLESLAAFALESYDYPSQLEFAWSILSNPYSDQVAKGVAAATVFSIITDLVPGIGKVDNVFTHAAIKAMGSDAKVVGRTLSFGAVKVTSRGYVIREVSNDLGQNWTVVLLKDKHIFKSEAEWKGFLNEAFPNGAVRNGTTINSKAYEGFGIDLSEHELKYTVGAPTGSYWHVNAVQGNNRIHLLFETPNVYVESITDMAELLR